MSTILRSSSNSSSALGQRETRNGLNMSNQLMIDSFGSNNSHMLIWFECFTLYQLCTKQMIWVLLFNCYFGTNTERINAEDRARTFEKKCLGPFEIRKSRTSVFRIEVLLHRCDTEDRRHMGVATLSDCLGKEPDRSQSERTRSMIVSWPWTE